MGSWFFGQVIFVQNTIPGFTLFFGRIVRLILRIFNGGVNSTAKVKGFNEHLLWNLGIFNRCEIRVRDYQLEDSMTYVSHSSSKCPSPSSASLDELMRNSRWLRIPADITETAVATLVVTKLNFKYVTRRHGDYWLYPRIIIHSQFIPALWNPVLCLSVHVQFSAMFMHDLCDSTPLLCSSLANLAEPSLLFGSVSRASPSYPRPTSHGSFYLQSLFKILIWKYQKPIPFRFSFPSCIIFSLWPYALHSSI